MKRFNRKSFLALGIVALSCGAAQAQGLPLLGAIGNTLNLGGITSTLGGSPTLSQATAISPSGNILGLVNGPALSGLTGTLSVVTGAVTGAAGNGSLNGLLSTGAQGNRLSENVLQAVGDISVGGGDLNIASGNTVGINGSRLSPN